MNQLSAQNLKKDYIWNTIGSIAYSAVSVVAGIIVIRIIGKEEGGLFSFGFSSLAMLVYSIAYFGVKSYQIVDVTRRFSFNTYRIQRWITSIASYLFGIAYILFLYKTGVYTIEKSIVLAVIILHGVFEGFFEAYDSEYQRVNKLYVAGIALFVRTVSWTTALIIMLLITKNLLISVIIGMLVKLITGYALEVWYSKKYFIDEKNLSENRLKELMSLTLAVLPLFITCFLDNYMYASGKYAIDIYMGDTFSGYFYFLFLPASLIYMIDYMIIRPYLSTLGNAYNEDLTLFRKIAKKIFYITLIICISFFACVVIFSRLYIFIVNIVTNQMYVDMENEVYQLLFINTLGGCTYVIGCPFYFYLIIEGKQNVLAFHYAIVSIISFFISHFLVKNFGLMGAASTFLISMILLGIGMFILYKKYLSIRSKSGVGKS